MREKWFMFRMWNGNQTEWVEDDNLLRALRRVRGARKRRAKRRVPHSLRYD